jgi:UDP-sulfoquinovose synthase
MRVFIAGIDGYLGWALAQHLTARGHEVGGADIFFRRDWVEEMGSWSAIPISPMKERLIALEERIGRDVAFWEGDLRDYEFVEEALRDFEPEAVVHLGECPSAPYSMMDREHAVFVQQNNIVSTFNLLFTLKELFPSAHLVKLGTMGEYGTPDVDIPEGFFDVEFRGRRDRLPFPRQAGSWYHWSKVHGSNNLMFACKVYGLSATDVMQGVVFGTSTGELGDDDRLRTRLDFDQAFGTAINRFCCQAVIEHPLTLYGAGSQKRGFLPLRDSMQCLGIAIENPPAPGEYRVLNQFAEVYNVSELATVVQSVASEYGVHVPIANLENPRAEQQDHHYQPDHDRLFQLGYRPSHGVEDEVRLMIGDLLPYRDRIRAKVSCLIPDIRWDGDRERVRFAVGDNRSG